MCALPSTTDSTTSEVGTVDASATSATASSGGRSFDAARVRSLLSVRRIGGLYLFAVMFVVFAVTIPDLFLTKITWTTLANEQAVTTIVAIGLTFALSAGVFDL